MQLNKAILARYASVVLSLIAGSSVFYFLYFFGAYGIQKGISYSGHSHLFRSVSFGVLTFAYILFFETWLKPRFKIKGIRKTIIWYGVLVLTGSQFIFLLFNYFWNWQEWNLEAYLLIQKEFSLMMMLPLLFYWAILSLLKPNKKEELKLLFQSENGKDRLKIKEKDFLYACASENYVSITYISGQQQKTHLIRKPLKVVEEELKFYPEVVRIHRSYLVNRAQIQTVKQSKGKVLIEIGESGLPVSKNYQAAFLN